MLNIQNNKWVIDADLNHQSVAIIEKTYKKNLKNISENLEINFSKVKNIDSSGLALLIEFIKAAKANNINLKLTDLNQNTIKLAKVYNIHNILKPYL